MGSEQHEEDKARLFAEEKRKLCRAEEQTGNDEGEYKEGYVH